MDAKKPLVFVFAGPSGHGKTELARNMGNLLNIQHVEIDCSDKLFESDLFGPKAPFVGSDKGSPLNNFLVQNSGVRSVVFLDEFSRTDIGIYDALLEVFDTGERSRTNYKAGV